MNPYIMFILLFFLGLGTTMTFASSHWLLAWAGLEINTLAIIPLMSLEHHPRAIEATVKYFLTQATAAATLLFAALTNAWLTGQWDIQLLTHPVPTTMAILALALKLGLAPLHTWLPEVLQGINLTAGLILSTWQKLAPMILLVQIPHQNHELLTTLAIASTLVGGLAGLNQTQLRKIIAYSSIAHLGWMIIVLQFSPPLTLLTLLLYIVMTSALFITLTVTKTLNINKLSTSWAKMPLLTMIAPALLLSLGGLPPLMGFIPKWLILQELAKQELLAIATVTALSALLSLYFYLRLTYSLTLTVAPNNLSNTPSWRKAPAATTTLMAPALTFTLMAMPITAAITSVIAT
uniref:NADH-ubiquinone oxidoreductase chain 2 n=1 Tax=Kraemeria cunicularia TaxID=86209 RepID=A0A347Z6I1_9GOBI|nr:NADH dehydrogenase subunit 2 [Kraemeria cunicularia]BBA12772.1 NADH dehydrogenase subunit 2 [Kraemeria cunicularia]